MSFEVFANCRSGIAIVNEDRAPKARREFELCLENGVLNRRCRVISIEVETGLADCANVLRVRHTREFVEPCTGRARGIVRMYANGARQSRVTRAQRDSRRARVDIRAGDDDTFDAGIGGAFEHNVEVGAEALVGQVGADVDHRLSALVCFEKRRRMSQALSVHVRERQHAFYVVARFGERNGFDPHVCGSSGAIVQPAVDAVRASIVGSRGEHAVTIIARQQFGDVAASDLDIDGRIE